jgi:hypothetical protein
MGVSRGAGARRRRGPGPGPPRARTRIDRLVRRLPVGVEVGGGRRVELGQALRRERSGRAEEQADDPALRARLAGQRRHRRLHVGRAHAAEHDPVGIPPEGITLHREAVGLRWHLALRHPAVERPQGSPDHEPLGTVVAGHAAVQRVGQGPHDGAVGVGRARHLPQPEAVRVVLPGAGVADDPEHVALGLHHDDGHVEVLADAAGGPADEAARDVDARTGLAERRGPYRSGSSARRPRPARPEAAGPAETATGPPSMPRCCADTPIQGVALAVELVGGERVVGGSVEATAHVQPLDDDGAVEVVPVRGPADHDAGAVVGGGVLGQLEPAVLGVRALGRVRGGGPRGHPLLLQPALVRQRVLRGAAHEDAVPTLEDLRHVGGPAAMCAGGGHRATIGRWRCRRKANVSVGGTGSMPWWVLPSGGGAPRSDPTPSTNR